MSTDLQKELNHTVFPYVNVRRRMVGRPFTEELTHAVVSSAHTVVVCVVRGRRGGGPGKHGALKVVFQ